MTQDIKLTEDQKKMVEENLAFVTYVAKKYFTKDKSRNHDIMQEGILAMCKAIKRFDPERAKFSTYMHPTIDGHLKRFVGYRDKIIPIPHQKHLKLETQSKAENAKSIFSLDKEIKNNSSNSTEEVSLMDIIPSEIEIEDKVINKLIIHEAIKILPWKEKTVIIYRYYFDLNQAYIGKLMGLSQVHVHRIERKALKKMRNYIEK